MTLPTFSPFLARFGACVLACAAASLAHTAEPARLLVTNALILTLADNDYEPFTGYLLVGADGRIAGLGRGAPPAGTTATEMRDAQGMFLMPGFLSGHSHLTSAVRRGRVPNQELDGLIDNPAPFLQGKYFGPGDLYAFALLGSLDFLRNGITSCYEYPSRPRGLKEELYKEMLRAELSSGLRIVYGYNVPELPLPEARQAFLDFRAFAEREAAGNPRLLKLALAKSGLFGRGGEVIFPTEVAIAKEFGLDLQAHFLESARYQMQNRADFKLMEDAGGLEIQLTYAHFIHHSEEILLKSVAARASMVWNPLSNGRLASGLADIPRYLKAGMTVGMGLDGQGTSDLSDPFENMRMGLYSLRMKTRNASILLPLDMLRLHTLGTARAIGVADKVGSLEAGKFADFLLVDPMRPDTGPVYDAYATVVLACNSANVDTVYVGGEAVVKHGQLLKFDAAAVARDAKIRIEAMKQRNLQDKVTSTAP